MHRTATYVMLLTTYCWGTILAVPTSLMKKRGIQDSKSACFFDGNRHPANSLFFSNNCLMQCYCAGDGGVSCMDLCTSIPGGACPPGMKAKKRPQSSDSGPTNCTCTDCVPAFCYTENDEKYKIGESYKDPNCTKRCTCTEEGRFDCSPLCPKLKCPRGHRLKTIGVKRLLAFACECPRQHCIKKRKRVCTVNGRTYRTGRPFVTDNCQSKCRCKRDGSARCFPACPHGSTTSCRANERLVEQHVPVPLSKGRCHCTRRSCMPAVIHVRSPPFSRQRGACLLANGTRLLARQRFVSSDCRKRCRCTQSGHLVCVALCRTLPVWCGDDEQKVFVSRKIRGSQCSCRRTVCRQRRGRKNPMCSVEGQQFVHGTALVDRNCTTMCTCDRRGVVSCKPLCPSRDSMTSSCNHGYKVKREIAVPMASRCSCTTVECIPFDDSKIAIKEHI